VGEFGSIDLNSKKSYYLQVKDLLQLRIERGEMKTGEKLPSETELCRELNVSRTVIRQSLHELEQLGLIRKRKGKGSFVSENKTVLAASVFLPEFLWHDENENANSSIRILTKEIIPARAEVVAVLSINENDPVMRIQRLYCHSEEPVILTESLLPELTFTQLVDEDLLWPTRYLNNIQGVNRFDHADHYLEVAYAGKTEARLLQISTRLPLLKSTTYSFNEENTPIAVDTTFLRSDRVRLRGTIIRHIRLDGISFLDVLK